MKEEDIIGALREILRCWDWCNSVDSPQRAESDMWRERFLHAHKVDRNSKEYAYFMCTPCEHFMKNPPEKYLDACKMLAHSGKTESDKEKQPCDL